MKRKVIISLLVILLALVSSIGATLAWFTATATAPVNTFQAGTVLIESGAEVVTPSDMGNVNPGDCFYKCYSVTNTGTKAIELRMTDLTGNLTLSGAPVSLDLLFPDGPIYIAPVGNDWKMRKVVKEIEGQDVESFEFYYTGGPIPGTHSGASLEERTVQLCIIVAFDGSEMDDDYQGVTLNLTGMFSAVQASNDAPLSAWEDAQWADWSAVGGWFSMNHYEALKTSMGEAYADYYATTKCFSSNGGNGGEEECEEETAYAGNEVGAGSGWWFYYDASAGGEQTIWAGQSINAGTVSVVDGNVTITLANGWELQDDDESVKIQGYSFGDLPSSRPASGGFSYKGNQLSVNVGEFDYYVIHLDVQKCE